VVVVGSCTSVCKPARVLDDDDGENEESVWLVLSSSSLLSSLSSIAMEATAVEIDWALLALDMRLTMEAPPSSCSFLPLLPSLFFFSGEDFRFLIRRIDDQPDFTKPFIFDPDFKFDLDIDIDFDRDKGIAVGIGLVVLLGERDKAIAVVLVVDGGGVDGVDASVGVAVDTVFSPARENLFFDDSAAMLLYCTIVLLRFGTGIKYENEHEYDTISGSLVGNKIRNNNYLVITRNWNVRHYAILSL